MNKFIKNKKLKIKIKKKIFNYYNKKIKNNLKN